METIRVSFRIDRNGDPASLTAVLPDLPANPGHMVCYAHIGQHSECTRDWYYSTRPAFPREYRGLLRELRGIYGAAQAPGNDRMRLRIVRRIAHKRVCGVGV